MWLAYGLTAAIGWGAADFLARYATQRIGAFRSLLFMQVIGLAGLSIYVFASGQLPHLVTTTPWQPWAWTLVASVAGVFFGLALYRAFQTGIMSVVSPVTASYAAITVPLSLLSGETLSTRGAVGVVTTLLGVVLASYAPPSPEKKGQVRSSPLHVSGPIQDDPPKVYAFLDLTHNRFESGSNHEPLQIQFLQKDFQLADEQPRIVTFNLQPADFIPKGFHSSPP